MVVGKVVTENNILLSTENISLENILEDTVV